MDHHIKGSIVAGLCARGLDVLTARGDQAARLVDEVLLERATALGRGKRSGTPRHQGGSEGVDLLISHHIFQTLAQSVGRYG